MVQDKGVDLATLQVISNLMVAIFTAFLAIFTFFLWRVSENQAKIARKQAEIADRQTQIQEALAKLETEPLIFLEFSDHSDTLVFNVVNMGRYGCLVLEVAVMSPDWEPRASPENEGSGKEILAQNIPVLAGERKRIKKFDSIHQIAGQHSEWWDEFVRKREFFLEVSYYYGGKPEEIRHDFFRVALSVKRLELNIIYDAEHHVGEVLTETAEIGTVEIAYRSSYHA